MGVALWEQAVGYPARLDRQMIGAMWTPGIVNGLEATPVTGMQIKVTQGKCVVAGGDSTNQGSYVGIFETDTTLPVEARSVSGARNDLLVAQVHDTVDGLGPTDDCTLLVLSGTPGDTAWPALPASAVELARWTVATTDTEVNPTTIQRAARVTVAGGAPPGSVQMFAGPTPPAGWLICDGRAVGRTQYPSLFSVIGTSYGAGDTTSTFNLPNMKGRVPVGVDAADASWNVLGEAGGEKAHKLVAAELPAHAHSIAHAHAVNINTGGESTQHYHTAGAGKNFFRSPGGVGLEPGASGYVTVETLATTAYNNVDHHHNVSGNTAGSNTANSGNTGSNGAHNILQPYLALNYIIKS